MHVRYVLSSVSLRLSQLSVIFHRIDGTVCIQFTHLSYDDCENTCALSYYHHKIGSDLFAIIVYG